MATRTTTALIAGVTLVAGLATGYGVSRHLPPPPLDDQAAVKMGAVSPAAGPVSPPAATAPAVPEPVQWRMVSTYAGDLPLLGTLGKRLAATVRDATGKSLDITFFEPDVLMPPLEGFDAVSEGRVDAVWGSAAYWVDEIPAAQWFAGTPFGPRAEVLLAWLTFGDGQKLWDALYARHGVKALPCGVAPPDAAGWFREPITRTADLRNRNIRIFGYGALVIERLGANAHRTSSAEIATGLADGTLDGAEFSFPAIDVKAGFDTVSKHYYFPGWQQGAAILELLVNKRAFEALPATAKASLLLACGDNIKRGLAEGGALQAKALQELTDKGVSIQRFSNELLASLNGAWLDVVKTQSAKDKDFRQISASLRAFRKQYTNWENVGYVR